MLTALLAIAAYLIGSMSFAVIVSRALGLADPRSYGSGNAGATNVLRSGDKRAAALTLLGDLLKGWFAVFAAHFVARRLGLSDTAVALSAIAVMLGHVYPMFFGFKGGKGVATALGVLLALNWQTGVIAALVWVLTLALWKYSSLAAIAAAIVAPFCAIHFFGRHVFTLTVIVLALFIIARHKSNIQNLLAGSESRVGGNSRS
jgi:acyl phosphate:glycerol-3-phosphate acyltransferase